MVRLNSAAFIVFMMAGILLIGFINPAMAARGSYSDSAVHYYGIGGNVYEHNPVTGFDNPKSEVTCRLYGTKANPELLTTTKVQEAVTDMYGIGALAALAVVVILQWSRNG